MLSKTEQEEWKKLLTKTLTCETGGLQNMEELVRNRSGYGAETLVSNLAADRYKLNQDRPIRLVSDLVLYRSLVFYIRGRLNESSSTFYEEQMKLVAKDPFGWFASLLHQLVPGLEPVMGKCEWWSELHLRFLIYAALMGHQYRDPAFTSRESTWMHEQ
ncbi:hypothetical protein JCM3765_002343 [Sporobolomyces pararoseus]